jgi:hypothetical protein
MTQIVSDLFVIESPRTMGISEDAAFTIDFTDLGTPSGVNSTACYDAAGTDKASMLSGSNSLVGAVATLKTFTPTAAGRYRLVCSVEIGGQTRYGLLDVDVFTVVPAATAITSGTYGSITGVASLAPRHANRSGTFDDTTRPTMAEVATFLDETSAALDILLAEQGFTTPVTQAKVKRLLDLFANQETAAICEGVNGSGRFGPNVGKSSGRGRWAIIGADAEKFIEAYAAGFERVGAARTYARMDSLGFRDTDEAGDDTFPLFQRKAFGDSPYQKDWDTT